MSCCPTPEVQGQSRLCIAKWIDQTWIPALCCCLCIVYVVCQHGYVEQSVRQARSTVCIFIRPFTRFVSGSIWIGGPIWVVRPSHCWNNFAGWTEIQWNWLTADWNLLSTVDQEFVTHRVSMQGSWPTSVPAFTDWFLGPAHTIVFMTGAGVYWAPEAADRTGSHSRAGDLPAGSNIC